MNKTDFKFYLRISFFSFFFFKPLGIIILLTISYRALNTVQVLRLRIPTLCTYVRSQRHISVVIHVTQVPVKPLEVISYTGYPVKSQNG